MQYKVEVEQEIDGRWIAEIQDLPGVLCYAATAEAAVRAVKALALRVLADRVEHGELPVEGRLISVALAVG